MSEPYATDELDEPRGQVGVLEGRDGWLFLRSVGTLDVLAHYTDPSKISEETIQKWAAVLTHRRKFFAGKGIAYQTLIAPDAHLVYRDKLPDDVMLADQSPFDRLAAALDAKTRSQCVYPLHELANGRDREETYQPVDVHWTDWGAWLAYRASIETLGRVVPNIRPLEADALTWSVQSTCGSLGAMATPERFAEVPVATVSNPASKQTVRLVTERRHVFLVIEQDAPELPTAVVFRDSFMSEPARFYSESFRRTVFVTSGSSIYYDLIEWEEPDVVIHEMGERRLAMPPVEPNALDFRYVFGDLMLDDPEARAQQRKSRTLARQGRISEALAANDDVLRRATISARLLLYRARLHFVSGEPEAALEALRHATTLDPSDAAPWHLLGRVYDTVGRLEEAAEAFATAVRAEPRQPAYWQLAMSGALRAGDLVAAEELRAQAVVEHPDSPALANAASWVLAANDRIDEAEESAAFAVRAEPQSTAHLLQLASVQISGKRWDAAAATVHELRLLGSEHPAIEAFDDLVNSHIMVSARPTQDREGTA